MVFFAARGVASTPAVGIVEGTSHELGLKKCPGSNLTLVLVSKTLLNDGYLVLSALYQGMPSN